MAKVQTASADLQSKDAASRAIRDENRRLKNTFADSMCRRMQVVQVQLQLGEKYTARLIAVIVKLWSKSEVLRSIVIYFSFERKSGLYRNCKHKYYGSISLS